MGCFHIRSYIFSTEEYWILNEADNGIILGYVIQLCALGKLIIKGVSLNKNSVYNISEAYDKNLKEN